MALCIIIYVQISIHAPHARSDKRPAFGWLQDLQFQSTLLMRGATFGLFTGFFVLLNFNPRSSCEERLLVCVLTCTYSPISIHAPHARSDAQHGILHKPLL